jgi:hypothetical protein
MLELTKIQSFKFYYWYLFILEKKGKKFNHLIRKEIITVRNTAIKCQPTLNEVLYCTGDGSSLGRRAGDQGAEGAAPGPEEGEEHQAQRQRHHGRHHQRRQDHAAQVHGQGILR